MTDKEIVMRALEAGFMISTKYGQKNNQPMPVSDKETLLCFARMIIREITYDDR